MDADALYDILIHLNGKSIYKIINRNSQPVGFITVSVYVRHNDTRIVCSLFMKDNDKTVSNGVYMDIPKDEEWTKPIKHCLTKVISGVKNSLSENFNLAFPEGKLYYSDIYSNNGVFSTSGYIITKLFSSTENGILDGLNMREIAAINGIEFSD